MHDDVQIAHQHKRNVDHWLYVLELLEYTLKGDTVA